MEELLSMIAEIRGRERASYGSEEKPETSVTTSEIGISFSEDHLWKKRKIFTVSDLVRMSLSHSPQCDICCNQSFQGHDQYQVHLRSKKHRKHLSAVRKKLKSAMVQQGDRIGGKIAIQSVRDEVREGREESLGREGEDRELQGEEIEV
jgi:hypothetical protein